MSGDGGYTLVEMLAALAILGLAMAGLAESLNAIRTIQGAAVRAIGGDRTLARAELDLTRLFDGTGPFRSGDTNPGLTGSATRLDFDCAAKTRCGAQIVNGGGDVDLVVEGRNGWTDTVPLTGVRDARFLYDDGPDRLGAWPLPPDHHGNLSAVAVLARGPAGETPVAAARLWIQQVSNCAFDPIIEDCRTPSP